MSLDLVERYLSDDLDPTEAAQLRQWLQADPAHRRSFVARVDLDHQLREQFRGGRAVNDLLDAEGAVPRRPRAHSERKRSKPAPSRPGAVRMYLWPSVAAAAVLVLMLHLWERLEASAAVDGLSPTVAEIDGTPQLLDGERRLRLQLGQKVQPGSLLTIGAAERLLLRYPDGSTLTVAAGSSVRLRAFVDSRQSAKELDLLRGGLSATIAPQPVGRPLRLHSPHGQAVVRGTSLRWQMQESSTQLEVYSGSVDALTADGSEQASVAGGRWAEITADGRLETGSLEGLALARGLIGYWTFDEADSSVAYDRSGFDHHGQLQDGARILPDAGRRGGAASFAGDGGHILIGDLPALQLTGAMTLAAWIKPSTLDQGGRIICKQGMHGQRGWSLNLEKHGVPAFQVGDDLDEGVARVRPQGDPPSLRPDEWVHVAGVFTPGEPMRLYIDGVLDERAQRMDLHGIEPKPPPPTGLPQTHQDAPLPVCIGARPAGTRAQAPFYGLIDEVRVYRRALGAEEVRLLYRVELDEPEE